MFKPLSAIALSLCCMTAHAHIVFDVQQATTGSYFRGALRVGHGCDGSAVTQISVTIPAGVQAAKPMSKAGWQVDIKRTALPTPYMSHGREVREDVSEIRWTAKTPADYLQNEHYDEFVVFAKLPESAAKLYWKTTQVCEQGRIDWHELPVAGSTTRLKRPAAVLELIPKAVMHGHHQH